MTDRGKHMRWGAALLCWIPFGAGLAAGEWPANSEARSLAASCAACHGTDGRAVSGQPIPRLAGMPKADFVAAMHAFRDGTRAATVMQQIAKGYDEAQTGILGDFFAAGR